MCRSGTVLAPQLLQVTVELLPRGRVAIKARDLEAPHIHVAVIEEGNLRVGREGGAEGCVGARQTVAS